jgi:hypothetical protein
MILKSILLMKRQNFQAQVHKCAPNIFHSNRAQTLGAEVPDGSLESCGNESELLLAVIANNFHNHPHLHDADFEENIIPKGRSVAHSLFYNKRAHLVSFNILKLGGNMLGWCRSLHR